MYKIDNESIEKKILNSNFFKDEEANTNMKESLIKMIKELCDYTYKVNDKLVDSALKEDNGIHVNDISVAILSNGDKKTYESVGLFNMAVEDERRIFIDDEYESIRLINGDNTSAKKKFKGKYEQEGKIVYFDYELKFERTFLELQELLFRYTEQYKIFNPMIFSPYSHKAFYVIFDSELKKKGLKLDFCFLENGIKAIQNKNLFWNIKKDIIQNRIYDGKIPYGESTKYLYRFEKTKKGKYVFPYPLNNQTIIYDIETEENGINIVTNKEMDDFVLLEYYEVDSDSNIVREKIRSKELFNNKLQYTGVPTRRIVSEGDIEHAIVPFRDWNGLKCKISRGDKGTTITRYSARYRADRKGKSMFSKIARKYITFSKAENKFLDDYANYVIMFLEYNYPEIEWVGEK